MSDRIDASGVGSTTDTEGIGKMGDQYERLT